MAANQYWADFIALAQMDAAETDDRSQYARDMLASMGAYMQERLSTNNVTLLFDLVSSEAVRTAVIGGIAAQAQAAADIQAAAAAVAEAVGG